MLDFHIHRRILSVLEDMQENLSSHTHAKERRSPKAYLQALKGDLPEAWRKIIGDKKVVLYNTSVAEPYIHTDSYLEKDKRYAGVFQKQGRCGALVAPPSSPGCYPAFDS